MKQKIKFLICCCLLLVVFSLPILADAQILENLTKTREISGLPAGGGLPTIVGNIIKAFLLLLGIILSLYLIWAGYTWMTAAGEADKVKKAKEMIRNGIIGVFVVFISYSITLFVINNLTSAIR